MRVEPGGTEAITRTKGAGEVPSLIEVGGA